MKFFELEALSKVLEAYEKIYRIKRISDNLIEVVCDSDIFYFDMTRSRSSVFIVPKPFIASKTYSAPFDIALSRCNGANILSCLMLNQDRILRFCLLAQKSYKQEVIFLQFEFSGKHTNVILLSKQEIVLEALRHIPAHKSSRCVKVGTKLLLPPLRSQITQNQNLDKNEILEILKNNYQTLISAQLTLKKQALISNLSKQQSKLKNLLDSLPQKQTLLSQSQNLQSQATLLLANLHKIKTYQTQITLKDFENNPITITLPKSRTPQEALNLMFKESKRLAKKAQNLHIQQENLESKINFLNQEIAFISKSQNLDDLKILQPPKSKKLASSKFEHIFIDGFKISIGRNKNENQELLGSANANDLWLHIKDIPSSHMIIHCGRQNVGENVIKKAGEILVGLCKIQSGNFCVDYTKRKFVKIIQGANVRYSKQQSLHYKK